MSSPELLFSPWSPCSAVAPCDSVSAGWRVPSSDPLRPPCDRVTLAPEVGFEPTTNRLTADRSTTELLRNFGSGRQN
jgi:hypothetical protein